MWVQDNPALLAHSVQAACDDEARDSAHPLLGSLSGVQRFAFEKYREKLEILITEELKREIRSINKRMELAGQGSGSGPRKKASLKVGGRRDELVERLLAEALRDLTQTADCMEAAAASGAAKGDSMSRDPASGYICLSDSDDDDDDDSSCSSDPKQPAQLPCPAKQPVGMFSTSSPDIALRSIFGFGGFLSGQRWAVDRCLSGQRSLLIMPTGAGKSLCYMVPAACSQGVTIGETRTTLFPRHSIVTWHRQANPSPNPPHSSSGIAPDIAHAGPDEEASRPPAGSMLQRQR